MNFSPVFIQLKNAINDYLKASSKTDYRFTIEEEKELIRLILLLDSHKKALIDYEIKQETKKDV